MHTLEEIQARLAQINQELETATGDTLTALEQEANELISERSAMEQEIQSRQALRSRIAAGLQPGIQVQTPASVPAATPAESVEETEARAFADYIFSRTNEQNFSVGNNGAVIPATIANRIIEEVTNLCPILQGADVYYVNGKLQIPVYGPKTVSNTDHDITVSYATEFQDLTADAGAFTSVDLGGYLIGALTLVGRSLQNNASFDVVSFVVRKIAEKVAIFVEGELLKGTGSTNNHCTGALSTTNSLNAGSTSTISADNLIELQSKVPQAYQANSCWTLNPTVWAAIKKLKYANGQYLVSEDFTQEFPYRLLGKPVHLSDNMPTIASTAKAVLYGDYSGLSVNIHENVSVEVLREKYATQHAIGVVAWMELDSKVTNAQKLATLVMST